MTPALCAILFLMLLAVPLLIIFDGRNARKRQAYVVAKKCFDTYEVQYSAGEVEYREVSPISFPELNVPFYEETTKTLEVAGFSQLGDVQNVFFANKAGFHTFTRVMVDESHTIIADFMDLYHPKSKHRPKVVDFTTEFDDGSFLETLNANDGQKFCRPAQMHSEYLPESSSAMEILRVHRERLAEFLRCNPRAEPRLFGSIQDVIAALSRSRALRIACRRSLSSAEIKQEFLRLAEGRVNDPKLLADIAEEYEKLYKSRQAKSQTGITPG
ncbi:MAG TPA: hypothetical protein VMP11_06665 [Verrucomicrobiae bacterium]|nr:hypothetical protein [Verrucomicrobiae bacterium]